VKNIREALAVPEIGAMKRAGTKIVMVTAYDHPSAHFASQAGILADELRHVIEGEGLGEATRRVDGWS